MIHKTCEKCPWLDTKLEVCNGNLVDNQPMYVGALKPVFTCGTRTDTEPSYTYFKIPNPNSIEVKTEERIQELEEKTSELSAEPISR